MENIIDYKITSGESHLILEKRVQDLIEDGYMPHGNMVAKVGATNSIFLQPMIKYERERQVL